ncbi:sensor histidine kinase [Thalassomonas haliotis]|uniref:Histidine kinase n=1 Tax=Thalassomonas haliotis TaxID=485448 RepID=A0ABY7VH70_9GAMM|nr:histidine kinase [Thalassomonas haliotis]WDE13070.1 histidine kinase [Thalassomonas haliotis]
MFRHPFFKYSFFILLVIDLSYGAVLSLLSNIPISMGNLYAALIWFVTFYWLPVWAAAAAIFSLRKKGINNTPLEWALAVTLMILGNTVTDHTLQLFFKWHTPMGLNVIISGLIWGSGIYFFSRYLEGKRRISIEETARKQAQLATLRYQLNPHFMFNSLNTISAYIHTKPYLADEVLHELADILRYSLDTAEQESISLKQEIDIINKYINIEKARFGDRLTLEFDIPENLLAIQVPPLILQPVIENAVKHNARQKQLHIVLKVDISDQLLKINIKDNGCGFSQTLLDEGLGSGIGIKNLSLRMAQLSRGKMHLSNDNGAVVALELAV